MQYIKWEWLSCSKYKFFSQYSPEKKIQENLTEVKEEACYIDI